MRPADLDGHNVLASGSYVVARNQPLIIYPFDHDPDFKLQLAVDLHNNPEGDLRSEMIVAIEDANKLIRFTFVGKYHSSFMVSTARSADFAIDDDCVYKINIHCQVHGAYEQFTTVFTYTVFKVMTV